MNNKNGKHSINSTNKASNNETKSKKTQSNTKTTKNNQTKKDLPVQEITMNLSRTTKKSQSVIRENFSVEEIPNTTKEIKNKTKPETNKNISSEKTNKQSTPNPQKATTTKESTSKENTQKLDTKPSKNPKRKNSSSPVLNIMMFICIIGIIVSGISIIKWFIENNKSKEILEEIQNTAIASVEQVVIDGDPIEKFTYNFDELRAKNSDTVGWIRVPNTKVDSPVVQTNDNDYYLNHSFDKSGNSAGWIFADFNNKIKTNEKNIILYGHNRKDLSMFGSLKDCLEDNWYNNPENSYIYFSTLEDSNVYKVFSIFVCNASDVEGFTRTSFSSDKDFQNYLNMLKSNTYYKNDTEVTSEDSIITLYTCYGMNNQRLLICAKLIK